MVPDDRITQESVFNISAAAWRIFSVQYYLVADKLDSMGRLSQ